MLESAIKSYYASRPCPHKRTARAASEAPHPYQSGTYDVEFRVSDGNLSNTETVRLTVQNTNLAPTLLPMPLELVSEGETLGFTLLAADADGDAVQLALLHDASTPTGVSFDPRTGYFEWTPSLDTVDNATENDRAFHFTFTATDGAATTERTVQVRVFDVNRAPTIAASSHAVVVGEPLSLPVVFGATGAASAGAAIAVNDPDGAAQTQALTVSFQNLPEGASYDAQSRRLNWIPGPGQVGDFTVTARVSDGRTTVTQTFVLRVVAEPAANAPKILVSTTPSTPAQPGQTILATVRAQGFSPIQSLVVDVRGEGLGNADPRQWQTVALDSLGRLRLTPAAPGLIEVRVTATDQDGFTAIRTHTIRVKDPADTAAPALAWTGALLNATAGTRPVTISTPVSIQASLAETQLMGYKLEIAPIGTAAWSTLAEESTATIALSGNVAFATLDPALLHNGVYQLRLSAWDLTGRTTEINARVVIDSVQKNFDVQVATDEVYTLGGHELALTRLLETGGAASAQNDDVQGRTSAVGAGSAGAAFGNWRMPVLDFGLTHDQPAFTDLGATATAMDGGSAGNAGAAFRSPWQDGARLWLQAPASLDGSNTDLVNLRFTLGTTRETLGSVVGAPVVYHPVFTGTQGWTLTATSSDDPGSANRLPDSLQKLGLSLYDQNTGLPWVPQAFTLTAPDGTAYTLDARGQVSAIRFADGVTWLVSDAGIALAGARNPLERIDFLRDAAGRIARVMGPVGTEQQATAYKYDAHGRLILARNMTTAAPGTPYGYEANGRAFADTLTHNFGAAVNWIATPDANRWEGTLTAGQTTSLAFTLRESEFASTVKTPGAEGAVIVAVTTETADPAATLDIVGGTVIGTATQGNAKTTLVRITEAGLKLIRLSGEGSASVSVALAGDLNRDGEINGLDSEQWEQWLAASHLAGDINGDGQVNATDRQVLYANYGLRANQAPVAQASLPILRTHTDLAKGQALESIAEDLEGDTVFWRVLDATHGTASLSADGEILIFTPETGYAGSAVIHVQADDGFAASAPIALTVNVSGARLLAIHLAPLASLQAGQVALIRATADFEDEAGVDVSVNGGYLTLQAADLSGMNFVGATPVAIDDARDLVHARAQGPALLTVSRLDRDGRVIQAVQAVNVRPASIAIDFADEGEGDYGSSFIVEPDVYPGTLALAPGGTRQLTVRSIDPYTGLATDISAPNPTATSGTRYFSSDESVATVSASGLITAHAQGRVTISVVHLSSLVDVDGNVYEQALGQGKITLTVQAPQQTDTDDTTPAPQRIQVSREQGAIVQAETGETVYIGAGALPADTAVSIRRLDVADFAALAPAPTVLETIGAFRLDLGATPNHYPVQLAIPTQGGASFTPGEEVWFFRKGVVLTANGYQDSWWLVDNGFIGEDGASPAPRARPTPASTAAGNTRSPGACPG